MSALRDALRLLERTTRPSFVIWGDARRCYFNGAARIANPMLLGESGSRFDRASPFIQDLVRELEAGAAAACAVRCDRGGIAYVGVPIFGIDGGVEGWIVSAGRLEDVPLVYRDLQSDASLLSQIANLLPLMLFTVRPSGERDFVNRAFVDFAGLLLGGGARIALDGLVHAADIAHVPAPWSEGAEVADLYTADLRLRRMDGAYRCHSLRLTAVRSRTGAIIKWIGTLVDIDDRRAAEAEVAETNAELDARIEELERVLDVVPIGIAIANGFESDEVRLNRALMEMLGEREPFVPYGHPAFRYLRAVDLDQTLPGEEGGVVELERADGTVRFVEVSAMPLRALDGNGGVVAAYVEVSALRRQRFRLDMVRGAQRQLARAASVAEVAAGIGVALESFVDGFALDGMANRGEERLTSGGDAPQATGDDAELGLSADGRKIVVDVSARGRTLARLTLCRAARSETFDREDLEVCLDVAAVAGIALDRAWLLAREPLFLPAE